ncbi:MAG: electron transport complex subunit E [Oscillospiraceae bacterium]|nr:electron transport complex subunit E [Oscillospiraceae bacterium]
MVNSPLRKGGRALNQTLRQFKNGLLDQNPTLVLLLGMCPTMAISTSLANGLGMGACATLVLICSNSAISLMRKLIPEKIRIAAYVVIIAGFVTLVDMLLGAFLPALSQSLGLFIPLIVVNCIILARAEAYASQNGVVRSALDGLTMGLGFTAALSVVSVIREVLGSGTLLGQRVLPDSFPGVLLLVLPTGGFLTLGFVIAATQKLMAGRKGGKS